MKKLLTLLFLIIPLTINSQEKIEWISNIDKGIKLGKKANKDVFIYLGEKKCVPCRSVEKYAFSTEKFINFSKKYIMVKVYNDLDKTKNLEQEYFKKAKKRFKTKMVPRFIVIRKGIEIANFFAYIKSPETLIDKIKSYQ